MVRFERPCFRRTDVRPKAAGALCSIMARKMMREREVLGAVLEAPNAIPSAHAWIINPIVVDEAFPCGEGSGPEEGESFKVAVEALCGPRERSESEI